MAKQNSDNQPNPKPQSQPKLTPRPEINLSVPKPVLIEKSFNNEKKNG